MKLKDLAKSLNNEYSSLQKWSFKYGFKSLNNSKIIELDSQQIEILTETARIFREHRAKGKRISFDEAKKIEIESLKNEILELRKDLENLRNKRFLGFKVNK